MSEIGSENSNLLASSNFIKEKASKVFLNICVSLKTTAELLTRKIFQNISDKN